MYLKQFPKTTYNFRGTPFEEMEVLDIMRRVAFKFQPYTLTVRPTEVYTPSLGDTPDIIAEKYYGDADYWWLVCLFNNIINPFNAFPRTGNDVQESTGSEDLRFIHVERQGGHEFRDFQENDLVIKCHPTDVIPEITLDNGVQYINVPVPLLNSDGTPQALARINNFNKPLRRMVLTGPGAPAVAAADKILALSDVLDWRKTWNWENTSTNHIMNWGKINKITDADEKILGFREKHTQLPVSPMVDHRTGKIKESLILHAPLTHDGSSSTSLRWDYSDTLIAGYLSFSGEGGNTFAEQYEAFDSSDNRGDGGESSNEYTVKKMRLLVPYYKNEAFSLFKKTLHDERFTINEYSSIMEGIRETTVNNLLIP